VRHARHTSATTPRGGGLMKAPRGGHGWQFGAGQRPLGQKHSSTGVFVAQRTQPRAPGSLTGGSRVSYSSGLVWVLGDAVHFPLYH
jgi:hypothetical protein